MSWIIAIVLGTLVWYWICRTFKLWGSARAFLTLWIVCMALSIGIVNGIGQNLGRSNKELKRLNGVWGCDEMQVELCTLDETGEINGMYLYKDTNINGWHVMAVDTKKNLIGVELSDDEYLLYKYKVKKNKLILEDKVNEDGKKYKFKRIADDVVIVEE